MSRIEALRSTLDRLSLDPSAAEDREYLVSMLRRLGYSELEIQAFMNEQQAEAEEDDGVRIIEVEYTGALAHTMKDYTLVAPADDEMFAIEGEDSGNALGLDDDLLDLDLDEFGIANFSDEDFADSGWDDDWGDDEEGGAQFDDIGGEHSDTDVDDFANVDDDEFADAAAVDFGGTNDLDDSLFDEAAGEDVPSDGNLLTFEEEEKVVLDESDAVGDDGTLEFGEEDMMAMAERGELDEQELVFEEGGDDLVFEEEPSFTEEDLRPTFDPSGPEEVLAEVEDDGPFKYGDYTLYTKEVEFSPDRKQRIYFFAKNEPQSGEPCGLPAGYEIKENAQTGLPFLRRVKDDGAEGVSDTGGKKNVKVRVIRGQSADEVKALMEQEGRKVLRTIPLHKHLVEED